MNIQAQLKELMGQEMDRKKFLTYAGAVVLSVVGVTGLVSHLTRNNVTLESQAQEQSSGYGASYYGN